MLDTLGHFGLTTILFIATSIDFRLRFWSHCNIQPTERASITMIVYNETKIFRQHCGSEGISFLAVSHSSRALGLIREPQNKGPVTRCNSSCNLHCNSTVNRCEIGMYESSLDLPNDFFTNQTVFTNLHVLKVELRCKLQPKF